MTCTLIPTWGSPGSTPDSSGQVPSSMCSSSDEAPALPAQALRPPSGKVDADPNPAPGNRSEYDYPSTGKNYGQSFLCISVDANQFDLIGEQLIYNQVTVYKKNIPEKYDKLFPKLTDAARQKKIKEPPYNSKVLLRSSGSVQFWSFAKSDKWQKGGAGGYVGVASTKNPIGMSSRGSFREPKELGYYYFFDTPT
ncbi:Plancitoxin-1 [Harpegnathos saltator]|uniref:Plancitoxin-1 n=1 Tax=Harpegnathos saltator TaxID=610380 RepID=E2C6E8_HARSA|nr:Plancitoxin-1 [Harpegnathos saltator]